MKASLTWTTGKVLYLYFCGALLGASLILLLQALGGAEPIRTGLLGTLLALALVVLPLLDAARSARQSARGEIKA